MKFLNFSFKYYETIIIKKYKKKYKPTRTFSFAVVVCGSSNCFVFEFCVQHET